MRPIYGKCGSNTYGALGDGTEPDDSPVLEPVRITEKGGYKDVALGYDHGLALTGDGTVHVWGSNQYGQLGALGSMASPTQPPRKVVAYSKVSKSYTYIEIRKDTFTSDGRLKVTVFLKDEDNRPLPGQRLTAKASAGTIGAFQEIYDGFYQANWTISPSAAAATVQVFLRNDLIKEVAYPPGS